MRINIRRAYLKFFYRSEVDCNSTLEEGYIFEEHACFIELTSSNQLVSF